MRVFSAFRYPKWSMRRKLFGYMFLLVALLLLALMTGLFLFGRFDSAEKRTFESLDIQMEVFEKDVSAHFDRLAAASIQLSEDMTHSIEEYLSEYNITFAALNDSGEDIARMQEALIEPLRSTLLQENCSGVFVNTMKKLVFRIQDIRIRMRAFCCIAACPMWVKSTASCPTGNGGWSSERICFPITARSSPWRDSRWQNRIF